MNTNYILRHVHIFVAPAVVLLLGITPIHAQNVANPVTPLPYEAAPDPATISLPPAGACVIPFGILKAIQALKSAQNALVTARDALFTAEEAAQSLEDAWRNLAKQRASIAAVAKAFAAYALAQQNVDKLTKAWEAAREAVIAAQAALDAAIAAAGGLQNLARCGLYGVIAAELAVVGWEVYDIGSSATTYVGNGGSVGGFICDTASNYLYYCNPWNWQW